MSAPVRVRPRRADDLDACVALLARVHAVDGYPTRAEAVSGSWLTAAGDVGAWVAVDDTRLLGHVALAGHGDAVEVVRLFTDPDARGRGVATALLAAAVDRAARDGRPVVLEVVEGTAAVGFYERAGWRPSGTRTATWAATDGTHPTLRGFAWPAAT